MSSNVLIVAHTREALEEIANKIQAGYHVFTAKDSSEAGYILDRQTIQLIICLAGLLPEAGWEHCRQFKSHSASAHIPLIMITGDDTLQARMRSLEAGADGHIGGPVFREHLDIQIRNLIANRMKVRRHWVDRSVATGKAINAREKEQLLKKLQECLFEQAPAKDLNVEQLAKLMHMSRPTLYRKMKIITDRTPNELINEVRLKRAAELLAAGEHRVFEVARMVGYTSQSSFGKSFLKQFKVTPATYQRMKKIMDAA